MVALRRLLGRMAVASEALTQGCVKLPGVESEAGRGALQAAFNGVVKKRFNSVQIPYFSFLRFLMGLNELDQGGTDKFLTDGECEIELPVVGSGRKRETTRATYNKGPGQKFYTFVTRSKKVGAPCKLHTAALASVMTFRKF